MRLASHAAHDPVRIKCQIAHREDSFFFCLEIFRHRGTVWTRERRVANKIEIRFRSAADNCQSSRHAVAAFGLNISQNRFAFETIQAFADQHRDAMLRVVIGEPRTGLRIEIAIQQIGIAMHHAHFHFHHPQTRRDFAGEQAAADDHDGFFQVSHFAQRERVANRPEINHVSEIHACDRWPHWPATHGQTRFREFDAFAVAQNRQTPLDVELLHDRGEAGLDFVRIEPALLEVREFFERWRLLAQKIFREHPAIVGRHDLRADNRDRAAFVVLANAFACARAANARADNQIVTLDHSGKHRR